MKKDNRVRPRGLASAQHQRQLLAATANHSAARTTEAARISDGREWGSNEKNAQRLVEGFVRLPRSPRVEADREPGDGDNRPVDRISAGEGPAETDATWSGRVVGRERRPGAWSDRAIDGMSPARAPQTDSARWRRDAAMPAMIAGPGVAGVDSDPRQQGQQEYAHELCGSAPHERPPRCQGREPHSDSPEGCQADDARAGQLRGTHRRSRSFLRAPWLIC